VSAAKRRVRQWEVATRTRRVIVLAATLNEAYRRAAPMLPVAPLTAKAFGPWSRP
jgi:hypothetical protein